MEKENQKAILGLITVIKEKVPNLKYIEVRDTESVCIRSKDPEKILKEMIGGDEEFGFNIIAKSDLDDNYLGWFGVMPYELPDEMVFDHSDNILCKSIYDDFMNRFINEKPTREYLEEKVKTLTEILEDAGTYLMDYEKHNENGYYGLAEESYQNLKDVLSDYIYEEEEIWNAKISCRG